MIVLEATQLSIKTKLGKSSNVFIEPVEVVESTRPVNLSSYKNRIVDRYGERIAVR